MTNSSKRLKELGEIIRTSPKGSKKYKDAMKELDQILGMPGEIQRDQNTEDLDDDD